MGNWIPAWAIGRRPLADETNRANSEPNHVGDDGTRRWDLVALQTSLRNADGVLVGVEGHRTSPPIAPNILHDVKQQAVAPNQKSRPLAPRGFLLLGGGNGAELGAQAS